MNNHELNNDIEFLCLHHPSREFQSFNNSEILELDLSVENLTLRLKFTIRDSQKSIAVYWTNNNRIIKWLYKAFTHNLEWNIREYHKGDWEVVIREEALKFQHLAQDFEIHEDEDLFSPDTTWRFK